MAYAFSQVSTMNDTDPYLVLLQTLARAMSCPLEAGAEAQTLTAQELCQVLAEMRADPIAHDMARRYTLDDDATGS